MREGAEARELKNLWGKRNSYYFGVVLACNRERNSFVNHYFDKELRCKLCC